MLGRPSVCTPRIERTADIKVTSDNYVPTVEFKATYVSGDHLNIPKNLHFVLDTLLIVVNIRRHYCLIAVSYTHLTLPTNREV